MVTLSVKLIRNDGSVSPSAETHMASFVVLSPSVSADGPKSSRYWLLTSAVRFNRRFCPSVVVLVVMVVVVMVSGPVVVVEVVVGIKNPLASISVTWLNSPAPRNTM
jgi:hypothetical protein